MSLPPSTSGRGLVNLVAEIERRLTGSSRARPLDSDLADLIPDGDTVCLVLFDGLGAGQVAAAGDLSMRGVLHAPFPTTTTVALATVATGRTQVGHGVIGHLMWLPEAEAVVNVLKFVSPSGRRIDVDHRSFLPGETLWERLRAAGVEPVTVQPGPFEGSPLSRAMYRGCRFESVWSAAEWVDATAELAAAPGRMVFAYWPEVDVAAHVHGRRSEHYRRAAAGAADMWNRLRDRISGPLLGTADHGHLDYAESDKILLRHRDMEAGRWYGDPRALMYRGPRAVAESVLADTGATIVEPDEFTAWFGTDPDPHPELADRLPDLVALAPPARLLLPPGFDRRLVGYHGGLEPAEVEIPLLVG